MPISFGRRKGAEPADEAEASALPPSGPVLNTVGRSNTFVWYEPVPMLIDVVRTPFGS